MVIEFPNKDKALGWYNSDEHQKIVVQRRKATDPKSTIVICDQLKKRRQNDREV